MRCRRRIYCNLGPTFSVWRCVYLLIGANGPRPICSVGAGGADQKPWEQRFDYLAGWSVLSFGEHDDTVSCWRECYASLSYVQC